MLININQDIKRRKSQRIGATSGGYPSGGSFAIAWDSMPVTDAYGSEDYWGPAEWVMWFGKLSQKYGIQHARWKFSETFNKNNVSGGGKEMWDLRPFNEWCSQNKIPVSWGSAYTSAAGWGNFLVGLPDKIITVGAAGAAIYGGVKYFGQRKQNQTAKDAVSIDSGLPLIILGGGVLAWKGYGLVSGALTSTPKPSGPAVTAEGKTPLVSTRQFYDDGLATLRTMNVLTNLTQIKQRIAQLYRTNFPNNWRNLDRNNNGAIDFALLGSDCRDILFYWATETVGSDVNANGSTTQWWQVWKLF